MALKEETFFGEINKIQTAIDRIKAFEEIALENNDNGYYVAISGGKDSSVIQQLCIDSGVKCEFVHHHTTADHPETVKFVANEKKRIEKSGYKFTISYPKNSKGERISMWSEISKRGFPTRLQRWCCRLFKEQGGVNRYVITGVRWSESTKRKNTRGAFETHTKNKNDKIILNNDNDMKRKLMEYCIKIGKIIVNPIIDWTDDDVWEYIKLKKLPYNPLYNQGYNRIGCVGCPMSNNAKILDNNPKFKKLFMEAGKKYLKHRQKAGKIDSGTNWSTPEKYYLWWTGQIKKENEMQIKFGEMEMKN